MKTANQLKAACVTESLTHARARLAAKPKSRMARKTVQLLEEELAELQ